jgi:predicted DNA-binding transcriptional regulator YafY
MRRADRLFQIIQVLRRSRGPITAEAIAQELETSKRTIYRDIADLVGQRAPIRGEAGVGYVLEDGFDMPPLMLTPEEVEACVLGAQFVAQRGDASLARAAEDLLAKIHTVIPERLRPLVVEPSTRAGPGRQGAPDGLDMAAVRGAIRGGRKLRLSYGDEQGRPSLRTVWPFGVGYFETTRLLLAWCELRSDFRSFRTDRVLAADFLEEAYPERPARLRARWTKLQAQRRAERAAAGGCAGG